MSQGLTYMKKKVYICAPLGGNVKENLKNAVRYTEYALKAGVSPITTHFYALCLDDSIPKEREIGMSAGQSLLWFCDEMWVFGNEITTGMQEEIRFCKNMKIRIRKVSDYEIRKLIGDGINDKKDKLEDCIGYYNTADDCNGIVSYDDNGSIRLG